MVLEAVLIETGSRPQKVMKCIIWGSHSSGRDQLMIIMRHDNAGLG